MMGPSGLLEASPFMLGRARGRIAGALLRSLDWLAERAAGVAGYPPKNYFNLLLQNARMEGFLVFHYAQEFPQAIADMSKWLAEGRIINKIDLAEGLENAPKTIIRLFTGANFGKQLLKLEIRSSNRGNHAATMMGPSGLLEASPFMLGRARGRIAGALLRSLDWLAERSDCVGSQVVRRLAHRAHRRRDFWRYPACGLVGNAPIVHTGHGALQTV